MKININNGVELREMREGSVGLESFAASADARVRNKGSKDIFSRIFSAVAELFSEKHQARAIIAEANRVSIQDGEPVYTSLEDLMDDQWLSGP